jgi:hypothetical protein
VAERVDDLGRLKLVRIELGEQLMEDALQPAIKENLAGSDLAFVNKHDNGREQEWLVRLGQPARSIDSQVLDGVDELIEGHR